jgi:DNA-directed RNA polymerase specialized sigma24 family protein
MHGARTNAVFSTTHWSVVLSARDGEQAEAAEALEKLCRTYWYPLYAFVRRHGHEPHDAQDLVQGFFAHLLSRDFLRGLSSDKGRFRAFLLASAKNFLSDQRDKARAQKRGGGQRVVSFDEARAEERYRLEPIDEHAAEKIFDRRWALTLLEQTMDRLKSEFVAGGKLDLFEALRTFQGENPNAATYATAAAQLGMPENSLKSHVLRFRRRYRELLCEEVAQTVAAPGDVEAELRHLKAVLAG